MSHHCHAIGCTKNVPPKLLMCAPHWRMVSPPLQRLVWRTYVPGQEITKTPTPIYLIAQACAVAYVATREGQPWTDDQAVTHVRDVFRLVFEAGRLSVADMDLLVQYEPGLFANVAAELRRIRELAS